jgi:hypothetical protein
MLGWYMEEAIKSSGTIDMLPFDLNSSEAPSDTLLPCQIPVGCKVLSMIGTRKVDYSK